MNLLERVPKIHLLVLDALLSHLNDLINSTEDATKAAEGDDAYKPVESDSEYIAKLGATLGPCIIRPAVENSKTLNDRFPAQLFADLLKDYSSLLPPTLEKKAKVEGERYAPKRQRTKMVDQRVTRSTTAAKDNKRQSDWLKEELERKMGHKIMEEPEDIPSNGQSSESDTVKTEAPSLPEKDVSHEKTDVAADGAATAEVIEEKEELQIPPVPEIVRPSSSSSEGEGAIGAKSSGFVTPVEEMTAGVASATVSPKLQTSDLADEDAKSESINTAPPASAALSPTFSEASAGSVAEDEDKPLVASASLLRSSTGSSASARKAALSRSGATRGPRPMSVHGPPSSAGGSTGSASSAAGVRARAAMFEQKSAPSPK